MNIIDRVISYVSPTAGFKRERARTALTDIRAYAGARDARGRDGWVAHGTGANAEIGSSMVKLRNRVRQLVRDDSLAKRIVDLWALHLVGDGITLDFTGTGAAKKSTKFHLWANSTQCDADGHLDFYGLQNLAVRTMVESGGVIIRKRIRSRSKYPNLVVPLQLQVLEPDFLDISKNGTNTKTGNPIVQGIEYDKTAPATRVNYWLFTEHPGENKIALKPSLQSIPIPAEDVIYMFRKDRTQMHGVTWLHAVVNRIRDLDDYIEALQMKAKIEACFTIIIEDDDQSGNIPGAAKRPEADFELEPGLVRRIAKGQKAHAFDPSSSGSHSILMPLFIRQIAVGVGLTYDQASSDLTGANYSSTRAGKLEFNQAVSQHQWHIVIPGMIEPISKWFVEAGYRIDLWSSEDFEIEVTTPKTQFVDPKKDGDAETQDMENGLVLWADRVRARGSNARTHRKALKLEIADFEKDGLVHPFSRPKKTLSGPAPAEAPGDENDDQKDDEE